MRRRPTARGEASVEQREDGGVRTLLSRELRDRAAVVLLEARVGAVPHQLLSLDDHRRGRREMSNGGRGVQGRAAWRGSVGWAGSAGARGQCGARRCGCPSDNPWLSSTLRSDPIALSCVSSSGQWREWGGAGARARMGLGRRWDVAIISRARCWGELTGGGYLALFCGRGGSPSRALRAARPGVHGRHAGMAGAGSG